ncbi:GNAT family N-acetyltransferase [Shewanella litorisediminis]|uniref:GNAT family N-acetyltransferase n=2 Tax=Shewanella litorisediminis TaxID=1173586 RepID=A0ABX7G8M0_9GAMM|nr:GNAT family N-acetyltransferase [Shewanella litorisediminis]
MLVSETERLVIRQFEYEDAPFVLRLLNEESFISYIADKNVRTLADAEHYLENGPMSSYQAYGFGLNIVCLRGCKTPIGMCGILKRKELAHPDLGYAFSPEFWGRGYALEAAKSVLMTEMAKYALDTVLAVTLPHNMSSNKLLINAGFKKKGSMELYGFENNLYEYNL